MEIICFGDSITRGYDVPYGQGWVEICDASIEGVHFTNYGEDGCSVQGMIYNIENGYLQLQLIQRVISS